MTKGSARRESFTTRRPVAVSMVFLAAVVFGSLSYRRLAVTLMPELSYPTVTVRTEYPGAAPEEVENDISRRIEESLGVVSGLRRMSSISRAGVSDVVLEFSWETEMSDAVQDTLEKLDLVFLPNEAERPLILRFDPSLDPVMELSLSGQGQGFQGEEGLRRLRRLAELQVKRALEPISGVAAVRVRGGLEEEIHVLLDAERLRRSGISAQNVIDRLAQENINVAGGTLEEGRTEYMVRTVNEYSDLDQIRDTVIAAPNGREVRIRDLGEVRMSHREREILTRSNAAESVQLDVYKEADANMVALAERVHRHVGELDLEHEAARERGELEEPMAPEGLIGKIRQFRQRREKAKEGLALELYRAEGAQLSVVADRSQFIEASIADVRNTAVVGGLLAVIVLWFFLRNTVTTLIVAVSIPMSLLITFAPLSIFGVSLNIMSLGGLALGIGMLVDSSIVVLESIYRCREEGDDLVSSAVRGTAEVRSAVVASILTSIAVFFPIVFVEGIAGQAFADLSLAVVMSLLASMAVALGFIPMLASRRPPRRLEEGSDGSEGAAAPGTGSSGAAVNEGSGRWRLVSWDVARRDLLALESWSRTGGWRGLAVWPLRFGSAVRFVLSAVLELVGRLGLLLLSGLAFLLRSLAAVPPVSWLVRTNRGGRSEAGGHDFLSRLTRSYGRGLRQSLRQPGLVLLAVLGIFVGTGWLVGQLETELLPEVRQGEFTFEVSMPVGTPLAETERALSAIESSLLRESESIRKVLVTYGFDAQTSQRSDEGEHTAKFKVLLEPGPPEQEDAVIARLRSQLGRIPDASARISRPVLFSFKTPIEVEVLGDDLAELRRVGDSVASVMAEMPELADVETTLRAGAPEVQIVYDRPLLSRYELDVSSVAQLVRNQVKGFEATLYNLKDRRIPILVRLEEADRRSTEQLSGLIVNPGSETPIVLGSVAEVSLGEGPSEVRRVDARRVGLVRANLGDATLGAAVAAIDSKLASEIDFPSGTAFRVGGQSEEWDRSQSSLWLALALSVFLVYVIMAAQFESLLHPLVIMFTIPLAFFGTFVTLWLFGVSLSIVVFLGMIMLAGIVVNNAIVLVDYINTLRSRGLEREEAIVKAGTVRLRPILMTTATTALGLLPMALGIGEGAEIRTPMALAVIGGLLTSTVLTLVIVPVIYSLLDRASSRLLGRESARHSRPSQAGSGQADRLEGTFDAV